MLYNTHRSAVLSTVKLCSKETSVLSIPSLKILKFYLILFGVRKYKGKQIILKCQIRSGSIISLSACKYMEFYIRSIM